MYLSPIMYVRTLQCFFNFPNVGKEVVRQKLVFLLSSRYFSIIRASSCELVKSSTNENSDNIFCLFPPRGCRVSLITEQLSSTHHILLFVSSKKEGVLEMREKPRIRPLCSPYRVTDTQPASTFPAAVCKLKISSFLFPEADCSIFTQLGVIDVTIPCRSLRGAVKNVLADFVR